MTKDEMATQARKLLNEAHHIRVVMLKAGEIAYKKEEKAKRLMQRAYVIPQQIPQEEEAVSC